MKDMIDILTALQDSESQRMNANTAAREGYSRRRNDSLDALVKRASLKESGYDIGPGDTLIERPDYVSTKALERQKLMNELDPNYEADRAAAKEQAIINARLNSMKRFGINQFGKPVAQGNQGQGIAPQQEGEQEPFVYDPITGTQKQNPAYVKPMNELQKVMLAEKQAKASEAEEAQKNKAELLRQDAESQLSAIQEAKRGIKYFGPFGNLPSVAVLSSLPVLGGEYGPRKEWENNVNKLLSGRIISLMNQMKQASRTGATGFGQLNRSELQLLQQASNVLSKDLPPDVAMKYLEQLEPIYQRVLSPNGQQAEPQDPLEAEAKAAIRNGADPQAVAERLAQLRSQNNG